MHQVHQLSDFDRECWGNCVTEEKREDFKQKYLTSETKSRLLGTTLTMHDNGKELKFYFDKNIDSWTDDDWVAFACYTMKYSQQFTDEPYTSNHSVSLLLP